MMETTVPITTGATIPTRPVVIALSGSAPSQPAPKNSKSIIDEDGFTKVVYGKSPKLASRTAILRKLQYGSPHGTCGA